MDMQQGTIEHSKITSGGINSRTPLRGNHTFLSDNSTTQRNVSNTQ